MYDIDNLPDDVYTKGWHLMIKTKNLFEDRFISHIKTGTTLDFYEYLIEHDDIDVNSHFDIIILLHYLNSDSLNDVMPVLDDYTRSFSLLISVKTLYFLCNNTIFNEKSKSIYLDKNKCSILNKQKGFILDKKYHTPSFNEVKKQANFLYNPIQGCYNLLKNKDYVNELISSNNFQKELEKEITAPIRNAIDNIKQNLEKDNEIKEINNNQFF